MRGNLSDDQQRGRIEERFMTYEKEIDEAEEMTKKVFVVIIAGFVYGCCSVNRFLLNLF